MIGDRYHPIRLRHLVVQIPASLYNEIDRTRLSLRGYGGKPLTFADMISRILGAKEEQFRG